ncbi:hypothetical protein C2G38_2324984, partial [Gigaspora rosea]
TIKLYLITKTKSLGSQNRHFKEKTSHRISSIRSLVSRSKKFSANNFKKQVKELFKSNNQYYSPDMIWLTTKLAQVGQVSIRSTVEYTRLIYEFLTGEPPKGWLSRGRVTTWHKQVSELAISNLAKNTQQTSVFGISADESTRGQDKNLIICFMYWDKEQNYPIASMVSLQIIKRCNADTIAKSVIDICHRYQLNTQKCATWLTDNTAYMSNGAIVKLNKLANSNSIRIGCGLHIINIVFTNFENEAFGHVSGFSRKPYPFNLLYLTWHLHDGYGNNNSVKFGNHFFNPLMEFIVGQDNVPRIFNGKDWINLPPGRRAHEMPDKVQEWLDFLTDATNNFDIFFSEELLEALELLNEIEFGETFNSLEKGMKKALLHFEKWIVQWLKLPLSVCRLGGNYAQSFTRSFRHVILNLPTVFEPSK